MSDSPILSLKGISKDYKQGRSTIEVLKNIDLEIYSGQTMSIVGSSGSGKSTLLHIAALLDKTDHGSVTIASITYDSKSNLRDTHKIRSKYMGFIYQNHNLLSDFTAQENAAMPLFIQGIKKSEAMERAADLLEQMGLGKRLCNVPGELSGGEQQRTAIARALINNPQIILADEPTGNLDPATAKEVFDIFLERAKKFGTAIIMVSHNLELAAKMQRTYKLNQSFC